jgi:D-beta-D-heptose 7-phosphate kinase/D-beta-D-heptose 1-phosphate adenosyltransferase
MLRIFPSLSQKKPTIMVFGDLILDHTIFGETNKLANEAPIPVLLQKTDLWTLGGCGNVAANLVAMGANVILCSAIGDDSNSERALQMIKSNGITWNGIAFPKHITTVKHRGFSGSKLIFRYDQECTDFLNYQKYMFDYIYECLRYISNTTIDAVVFSDYNKGFCSTSNILSLIPKLIEKSIPIIVDPKGDFKKYLGCTFIKPNYDEAGKYYKDYCPDEKTKLTHDQLLEKYHSWLRQSVKPTYSCITRAKDGISLCKSSTCEFFTSKTPAIDVIDVTGAGDVVTAACAFSFAIGLDPQTMINSATFLATQSVQHRGTYICKNTDFWNLRKHLHTTKCISNEDLVYVPRDERIVFTNGCFDLLHAGHLSSLEFAKKQGDILVVGINSDESIQRLKGPMRPIQTLKDRIAMLEGIQCVDYIIPFNEDTPKGIVEILKPSVLVKGEDYINKHINSAEFAEKVVFVPMKPETSTTSTISRILSLHK